MSLWHSQKGIENLLWFEEKNPLVALLFISLTKEKEFHFPKISFSIPAGTEVLYIDRVRRCFSEILPFLNAGGHVVFVEEDINRIYAFLHLEEFTPHPNLTIITKDLLAYKKIAHSYAFKKSFFVGTLRELEEAIDGIHMALSDYRLLGEEILPNMQANLLYADPFIDGRSLKDAYKGTPAVIVCSGPSLERSFTALKNIGNRALVFAAGSSMRRLEVENIPFHYGVAIDPNPPLQKGSFPLFYQGRVSEHLLAAHKGQKIWMGNASGWPIEEWLYRQSGIEPWSFDTGWNAGTFAIEIASFLGCDPILVVGMDGGERRDLEAGCRWADSLPSVKRVSELLLSDISNDSFKEISLQTTGVNKTKVLQNLLVLNDPTIREEIEKFLLLKEPTARDRLLLEMVFLDHPLYQYFLAPLWQIFRPLYEVEGDLFLQEILFYQKALAWQDKKSFAVKDGIFFRGKKEGEFIRKYPSGKTYAIERYKKGEREGKWTITSESEDLLSSVEYKEGKCHGEYTLYGRDCKRREGEYREGERVGRHKIYKEEGEVLWESK
ncbi:MAG: DUF115 domain-containing protein [Verrucomicrobia bacterium]|nr:DUF115 domain-containing protein [Verrucomicrobiota bacterium]